MNLCAIEPKLEGGDHKSDLKKTKQRISVFCLNQSGVKMNFVDINSPYHILVLSIIFYLLAYDRRVDQRVRDMKINLLLEKILFPFSKMGKAALISIIIAAYIECSLLVSYIAIGILKAPVYKVNIIWNKGTFSMMLLGTGLSIFYEVPASEERKVLKAIVYMIAVGCIGYGCERLIALITILFTYFNI